MSPIRLFVANALIRAGAAASGQLFAFFLAARFTDHVGDGARIVGLLGACYFLTELVGAPIAGRWADRVGQVRILGFGPVCGAFCGVVGTLATIMDANRIWLFGTLFVARAVEGLSAACSVPTTLVLLSRATQGDPVRRTRWMGFFEITSLLAMIVGYVFAGLSWDMVGAYAFLVLPLLYGIALFVIGSSKSMETRAAAHSGGLARVAQTFARERGALYFGFAWLAVNAVVGVWLQQAPFLFKITHRSPTQALVGGFNGREIGLIFAGWGVLFLAGILLWAWLGAHLSRRLSLIVALLGMVGVVASLTTYNHGGSAWFLGVAAVCVLVESGFTPAALAHLADMTERHDETRGAALGLYSLILGMGQLIGNVIGAPFAARWQMDGVLLVTGALALLALGGVVKIFPREIHQRGSA